MKPKQGKEGTTRFGAPHLHNFAGNYGIRKHGMRVNEVTSRGVAVLDFLGLGEFQVLALQIEVRRIP